MKFTKVLVGVGVMALTAVGVQLATVQAASAHAPNASITCTNWSIGADSYQADQQNTYSYSIDGAPAVTGDFGTQFAESGTFTAGSGNHSLVGYVYQNNDPNAQYSTTYNLSTAGCSSSIPIPAAPVPTPPTCATAGVATIPSDSDTVHWTLAGNVATATAQGDNRFAGGSTTETFTENVLPRLDANGDNCAAHLTVAAPVFTNGDCATAPTLSGATGGTGYTAVVQGTPGFGRTVTVTFTPKTDYRLDGKTVYTFTYASKADCSSLASLVSPVVTQATCDHTTGTNSGFTITPGTTTGITYTVAGLVVTATADEGFELAAPPSGWTSVSDTVATYLATRTDAVCSIDVTSASPTFADDVCHAGDATTSSVTVPASTGIDFFVNGTLTAAGSHRAADSSVVTVTARARAGYTLIGTTSWSHTFGATPTCTQVAAVAVVTADQPPAALASTGVPTEAMLLLGGLLVLLGGIVSIAGIGRRRLRS